MVVVSAVTVFYCTVCSVAHDRTVVYSLPLNRRHILVLGCSFIPHIIFLQHSVQSPHFHFLPTFLISGERGGDRYEWSRGDRDRDGGRRRDDDRDRR